jgi:hypothetical protein
MHLAYFDETGTDGHSSVAMFGALIVPTGTFGAASVMHHNTIRQILPADNLDVFQEFHASALYHGKKPFEGIDEPKRFLAILTLLAAVRSENMPFIYAAVDRREFKATNPPPFGASTPLHAAFHMCLLGVEEWATENHFSPDNPPNTKVLDWQDIYLCILDDCDNNNLKNEYRRTYRTLRSKHPFAGERSNRLWHAHDVMFFADSTDSLGIQMADLCNYFVRLHLEGTAEKDGVLQLEGMAEKNPFYELISPQVICAKPSPEWQEYNHLFRNHEDIPR